MFCSNCGERLNDRARFCHACGEQVEVFLEGDVDLHHNQVIASEQPEEEYTDETHTYSEYPINTDEMIYSYIGDRKVNYYLNKWHKGNFSWNWSALFFSLFWLGYRKMYAYLLWILAIYLLKDIAIQLLGMNHLLINTSIGIVIAVFLGLCGNMMYEDHVIRKVRRVKGNFGEKALAIIRLSSGPSWGGFWIAGTSLFIYGILYALITLVPPVSEWNSLPVSTNVDTQEESTKVEEEMATDEELKEEITTVLNQYFDAMKNEDIDSFMSTIYYDASNEELYAEREWMMLDTFQYYDLDYALDDIKFLSIQPNEVIARVTQTTWTKERDVYFNDYTITERYQFKEQDGEWKIVSSFAESVTYLGAVHYPEGRGSLENAEDFLILKAPGVFDYSVSEEVDVDNDGTMEVITITAGPAYDNPEFNHEVYLTVELNGVRTSEIVWAENKPFIYLYDINQDGVAEILFEDGTHMFFTDVFQISDNHLQFLSSLPGRVEGFAPHHVATSEGIFPYEYIVR